MREQCSTVDVISYLLFEWYSMWVLWVCSSVSLLDRLCVYLTPISRPGNRSGFVEDRLTEVNYFFWNSLVGNKILLHFLEKLEVRYYFTLHIRLASPFVSHEHVSYFEEQRDNILNLVLLKYVWFLKILDICLSSRVIILFNRLCFINISQIHCISASSNARQTLISTNTHFSLYNLYYSIEQRIKTDA